VAQYFHGHGAEIAQQNRQLKLAFAGLEPERQAPSPWMRRRCAEARSSLERSFDAQFGGSAKRLSFRIPGSIERCLRQWRATSTETTPDLRRCTWPASR